MSELHISVAPEKIAHIGGLTITNSLLTILIVMVILLLVAYKVNLQKEKPLKKRGTFYLLFEMAIEGFYNFFKNVAGERVDILFPLLFIFRYC